jgi:hypothetical protein
LVLALATLSPAEASADDFDQDGIDDQHEAYLLDRYAPVVLLNPDEDQLPANVDWFLQHGWLRFHHDSGCSDCAILDNPDQTTLIQQQHRKKKDFWHGCSHYENWERSWIDFDNNQCFFLQISNSSHYGSSNPADWITYGHVFPNTIGGINVQYWFFYSYNDGLLTQNHEGDWEGMMVELRPDESVSNVYYSQHGGSHLISPNDVTWYNGTHPIAISALGSHASYHSFEACSTYFWEYGCYWHTPVESSPHAWFTWAGGRPPGSPAYQGGGVVNVGEKVDGAGRWLNGQKFIYYSGKWGEIGTFGDDFSGPRGPAYQDNWNQNRINPGNLDHTFVDDDYDSSTPGWGVTHFDRIYDGIFHVKDGGTVHVSAGTYYERLRLQKRLRLEGEDGKDVTFIDAQGQTGMPVLRLEADEIQISGFTIQNGSVGVEFGPCSNGLLTESTIRDFTWGVQLWPGNENNVIYRNNFIDNAINAGVYDDSDANAWSYGVPDTGNYWDDYAGSDSDGDGFGDTPYAVGITNNVDHAPLMAPNGWLGVPDPYTSAALPQPAEDGGDLGMLTCPSGDGGSFEYVVVHLLNLHGQPVSGIPASVIAFQVSATAETQFDAPLALSFTPVDPVSDAEGRIHFAVTSDSSVIGDIVIEATCRGYDIEQSMTLRANSPDLNADGDINLSDIGIFSAGYADPDPDFRFDLSWDGVVNLSDVGIFASHNGH